MKRRTKKQIKVQDLKPKKDAKGGATRPQVVNPHTTNPRTHAGNQAGNQAGNYAGG